MWEITCRACGGLVESEDVDQVLALAREHCLVAHGYDVPEEHLRDSIEEGDGT